MNKKIRIKSLEELINQPREVKFDTYEFDELSYTCLLCDIRMIILENKKQKEFIDWLENEIENCKYGEENYADGDDMSYHNENELRIEILSKYKEIIGEKDE